MSTLLVAVVYNSSMFFVPAEATACTATSKTTTVCAVTDEEGNLTFWDCKKNKDGKTWSCKQQAKVTTEGSTSPALTDALNKAMLAKVQANTTGANDTDTKAFDRLNDRGINEQGIENNDNNDTKVPKDLGGLNDDGDRLTN